MVKKTSVEFNKLLQGSAFSPGRVKHWKELERTVIDHGRNYQESGTNQNIQNQPSPDELQPLIIRNTTHSDRGHSDRGHGQDLVSEAVTLVEGQNNNLLIQTDGIADRPQNGNNSRSLTRAGSNEAVDNDVDKVHENKIRLWAKNTSKLYNSYVTVANEYKTIAEHGADAADRVKITGSLEMNEYYSSNAGEIKTYKPEELFTISEQEAPIYHINKYVHYLYDLTHTLYRIEVPYENYSN